MRMTTKRIAALVFALVFALCLSSCSGAKLADTFDEDEVITRAKEVVEIINTLDYAAMTAELREDLQDDLTPDKLKESWDPLLSEADSFTEFKSVTTAGQKSKETGEDYAIVVLVCKYENSTRTITLVMDTELALVGMYMK